MQFSKNSDAETGHDVQSNWAVKLGQFFGESSTNQPTGKWKPTSLSLSMSPLVDRLVLLIKRWAMCAPQDFLSKKPETTRTLEIA